MFSIVRDETTVPFSEGALCDSCESLRIGDLLCRGPPVELDPRDNDERKYNGEWEQRVPIDLSSHSGLQSIGHLREAARLCHCCNIIYHDLARELRRETPYMAKDVLSGVEAAPINLRVEFSMARQPAVIHCSMRLTGNVAVDTLLQLYHDSPRELPWQRSHRESQKAPTIPQRSPMSQPSIAIVKTWLKECDAHARCSAVHIVRSGWPSRLLSIGSAQQPLLCLIVPSPESDQPYVALSYCWGLKRQTTLLSSNKDAFSQSIMETELPQTIKDTLYVARSLGFSYVWVDALCIIQDDVGDWETEAAKMGQIYQNASLTLCASRASTVYEGFLGPREPLVVYCGTITQSDQPEARVLLSCRGAKRSAMDQVEGEPVTARGWCLQERLMSRRIVYYSDHQMMWQCVQGAKQETGWDVTVVQKHMYDFASGLRRSVDDTWRPECSVDTMWTDVVEEYSDRTLSRVTDRLPAMSGLALQFKNVSANLQNRASHASTAGLDEDTYLAGHWLSALPYSLLWWPAGPGREIGYSTRARPSWSWIAVQCKVQFTEPTGYSNVAHVIDHHVRLSGSGTNPHGDVDECWLVLSAPVYWISLAAITNMKRTDAVGSFVSEEVVPAVFAGKDIAFIAPDTALDRALLSVLIDPHYIPERDDVGLLVLIRRLRFDFDAASLEGILIARSDDAPDTYTRAGLFTGLPNIAHEASTFSTIKLV